MRFRVACCFLSIAWRTSLVCGFGGSHEVDWLEDCTFLGPIWHNGMAWGFSMMACLLSGSFWWCCGGFSFLGCVVGELLVFFLWIDGASLGMALWRFGLSLALTGVLE